MLREVLKLPPSLFTQPLPDLDEVCAQYVLYFVRYTWKLTTSSLRKR